MATTALAAEIVRYTETRGGSGPHATAIPALTLLREERPTPPMPLIYKPALCLVAQGAKQGTFGSTILTYRAGESRVIGVEMPGVGRVTEASDAVPFLGAVVEFDLVVLREVLEGLNEPLAASHEAVRGAFVADLGGHVAACVRRLIELLETPRAIPTLVPAVMRELAYWLLTGPSGSDVASAVLGVDCSVIAAIQQLRARFAETIRVGELAATARMSASAFHRTFKTMTSLTPLQYQKQMRLLEARNLMLVDAANAETAAYRVGYESPSQFSREYTRMFGAPPHRDTATAKTVNASER